MRGWALIVVLALAGCGKKKPPEAPANTGAKSLEQPRAKAAKPEPTESDDADGDASGGKADEDPCAGGR